jgi:hypothetical protein
MKDKDPLPDEGQKPKGHDNDNGCRDDKDKRRDFHFTVEGELLIARSEGDTAELSVRTILDMSGNQPPENFYLVEFRGDGHKDRVKYEDLDKVLNVKDDTRFGAVFKGCTPVS